jgi:hypothetical protein
MCRAKIREAGLQFKIDMTDGSEIFLLIYLQRVYEILGSLSYWACKFRSQALLIRVNPKIKMRHSSVSTVNAK